MPKYLLYRENQQRDRWEAKFASFSDALSHLNPANAEQLTAVNELKADLERVRAVFADLVAWSDGSISQNAEAKLAFIQLFWSRMEVQNRDTVFDAQSLVLRLHAEVERSSQTNNLLIVVLLSCLAAYIAANYLLIYRRTLNAISKLQEGTRIIGSGNLDFAMVEKTKDEIGE